MRRFNLWEFLAFIITSEVIGSLGSIFTAPAIPTWYNTLTKPSLNPPNWIFAPVWTTLFFLMGISAYLIWRYGWEKKQVKSALYIFILQFAFNVFWSIAFFGLKSPFLGLLVIIILWILILLTIMKFSKINKRAGWLLLPYLLWVTFAAYLNFAIFLLNR